MWNPSPLPRAAQLQVFPWQSLAWLVVNEGEVRDLLAAFGAPARGEDNDVVQHASALLRALHAHPKFARGVSVICTLGARGLVALLSSAGEVEVLHVPAATLAGPVVDTTGAGDCFAGYFVAGIMQEADAGKEGVLRALRRAVEVR